jgi:twitching motility protein PilT
MDDLKKWIQIAVKDSASDVHLIAGSVPFARVRDVLKPMSKSVLSASDVQKIASSLLTQIQLRELDQSGDVDLGVVVGDVSVRVNIHRHTLGLGMAIRVIPKKIPSPETLRFNETMMDITKIENGFVIVSGPTGSGKSTTLASIVDQINSTSARHIITLEDPIEYRFTNQKSLIEQRQLGTDFPSFQKGLRHVLRQDPDVIVVGEMRDPETISLALTAAETGHLVLSTLHAPNAPEVVERIVNVFEGAEQQQVLVQLAATFKMVIAQRLVPSKNGPLVAAREILTSTPAVQNAIRMNNLSVIRSSIQTGKKFGMISMDQSIAELKKEGIVI